MGSLTDAAIACWQEESGIEPVIGERYKLLRKIQNDALDLIRTIELEISGIRGGDGWWHGSNPLAGQVREIVEGHRDYESMDPALEQYRMANEGKKPAWAP